MSTAYTLIKKMVKALEGARHPEDKTIDPLRFFASPEVSNWMPQAKQYLEDFNIPHYSGVEEFEYDLGLTEPLVCLMEYEEEETGARERGTGLQLEPDYPANATLIGAYLCGVDIIDYLDKKTIENIEIAYLEGF